MSREHPGVVGHIFQPWGQVISMSKLPKSSVLNVNVTASLIRLCPAQHGCPPAALQLPMAATACWVSILV